MKALTLFFASFLAFSICKAQNSDTTHRNTEYANAVFWTRSSGEYRALNFQAYNFARLSLDQALKKSKNKKPKCVIVDIDETVLDNSAYYEHALKEKKALNWPNWKNWLLTQSADTVPGAVAFLRYAASKKISVFYVTNREEVFNEVTLQNLQKYNFPNADQQHYLPMVTTYNKDARRVQIAKDYDILLLAGDNLSDFTNLFYEKRAEVKDRVNQMQAEFGHRFIMLPNAIYGSWKTK